MHRPSTRDEHRYMFGERIVDLYRIVDHDCQGDIAVLDGTSYSGGLVRINRLFMEADYKITIGLVEPHFMAGFSGGPKTICPGLSALKTIENFHGYTFLSDPKVRVAVLDKNPCHKESVSVASLAGVGFSINLILDRHKRVVKAFAGNIFAAHEKACDYVRGHACPPVRGEADVVVTGCGGYPLDATFYQCTKALVTALPCVRKSGQVIAAGGCVEGVGSGTYKAMLHKYNNDYHRFIEDIKAAGFIIKDQWQIQMQARFDAWVGWENVHFYTHGIAPAEGTFLGVRTESVSAGEIAMQIQAAIDSLERQGCSFAVLPEGPYCTPLTAV
ncbi:MAG: lactate racemase domain-containing protein [Thermodesulfobacteriota bacterium]|nr:lactate racemase domain-containing protein [Thermodesulfobacteriota bacterium]